MLRTIDFKRDLARHSFMKACGPVKLEEQVENVIFYNKVLN